MSEPVVGLVTYNENCKHYWVSSQVALQKQLYTFKT